MLTRTCQDGGGRERALCGGLDDAALGELASLGVVRRLARGDTLLRAGDPTLVCANVQSGALKIASVTARAAFDLPLSRGEIGDLLGLTIETVSRQTTRLRAAGIIDLPGGRGIVVRDAAGLRAAAEEWRGEVIEVNDVDGRRVSGEAKGERR